MDILPTFSNVAKDLENADLNCNTTTCRVRLEGQGFGEITLNPKVGAKSGYFGKCRNSEALDTGRKN